MNYLLIGPTVNYTNILLTLIILLIVGLYLSVNPPLKNLIRRLKSFFEVNSEEKEMERILKSVTDKYITNALIVIDVFGNIISWNKGAEMMFGRSKNEMKNKNLIVIIPEKYHESHMKDLETYRQIGISKLSGSTMKINALRKDGTEFPVDMTFYLDKSISGFDVFIALMKDDSDIIEIENNAAKKVSEMENYEVIGNYGGWTWDFCSDKFSVTKGFKELYEIEDDEISSEDFVKRIHIEDKKQTSDKILQAYSDKKDFELTYRIKKIDEEIINIHCKAKPILDNYGDVIKFKGIIQQLKKST